MSFLIISLRIINIYFQGFIKICLWYIYGDGTALWNETANTKATLYFWNSQRTWRASDAFKQQNGTMQN